MYAQPRRQYLTSSSPVYSETQFKPWVRLNEAAFM